MKLCTICDKKIEGTWCKTCHRFVKTYDLPEGIHLNESHNPKNDAGCTYHTEVRQTTGTVRGTATTQRTEATRGATTSTTRQTYTQTKTSTGTKQATGKKKKGKIAVIIITIYLVFSFLGGLIPSITDCVGAFSEEFMEEIGNNADYDDEEIRNDVDYTEEEIKLTDEELKEYADVLKRTAALQVLTPVENVNEETYQIKYYEPEDIKELDIPCEGMHYDMTYTEFERWLQKNWTETYETEDDSSCYYNYHYEDEDVSWIQFATYKDYYASDDFAVRVEYDTATEQLHLFGFVATKDGGNPDLAYAALKEFDPEADWTKEKFAHDLKAAIEIGEQSTFYYSDNVQIVFEMSEGVYSLVYYPVNQ